MKRYRPSHLFLLLLLIAGAVVVLIASPWNPESDLQWRQTLISWLKAPEVAAPNTTKADTGKPKSDGKAATHVNQPANKPARQLLAQWRSFSYAPPRYAIEVLQVYDDWSCKITTAKGGTGKPCSWKRVPGDRFVIEFPNNTSRLSASLGPPLSIEGKKQSGTASYLSVKLDDKHRQTFVLAGSADEKMVVDTVKAGYEWNQGNHREAIAHYRNAIAGGSTYARITLAWILATMQNFQQPEAAIQLLTPLDPGKNYAVANTLAAAYAANKQYDKAVTTGESACRQAPKQLHKTCMKRLSLYRKNQAFVSSAPPSR